MSTVQTYHANKFTVGSSWTFTTSHGKLPTGLRKGQSEGELEEI